MSDELTWVCDCPTKDALVCKEHPDCRPSYCKMRLFDPPIFLGMKVIVDPSMPPGTIEMRGPHNTVRVENLADSETEGGKP